MVDSRFLQSDLNKRLFDLRLNLMGRFFFKYFSYLFQVFIFLGKLFPDFAHRFFWEVSTSFSGPMALLFRYLSFSSRVKKYHRNAYIGTHVVLKNIRKLEVGENFSLHDFCYVDALGGISIGDNVSIAHGTSLISFNHTWSDSAVPIKYNPLSESAIVIGDDVWVGCGVRIMPGVIIGRRSVIAAGAVVTKDVPEGVVVAGVPAKVIRSIVA